MNELERQTLKVVFFEGKAFVLREISNLANKANLFFCTTKADFGLSFFFIELKINLKK